jgi:toxin CptA
MSACGLLSSLAIISLWLSELAGWLALAGSILVAGWGLARIRAERCSEAFEVVIPWDAVRPVVVAGAAVEAFELEWRGPLALLRWKVPGQGRDARLWWPDLLPPPARRELRLAASARAISSNASQMAP